VRRLGPVGSLPITANLYLMMGTTHTCTGQWRVTLPARTKAHTHTEASYVREYCWTIMSTFGWYVVPAASRARWLWWLHRRVHHAMLRCMQCMEWPVLTAHLDAVKRGGKSWLEHEIEDFCALRLGVVVQQSVRSRRRVHSVPCRGMDTAGQCSVVSGSELWLHARM
jgi:hypothetical protein